MQINDNFHAELVGLGQQCVKVLQRTKFRLNGLIIADIIAVIFTGRLIEGREPDDIHTQLPQIGQPRGHAGNIPDSVPIRILKTAGVYLVNHRFFPPCFFHFLTSKRVQNSAVFIPLP